METSSTHKGPKLDEAMKAETEPIERSAKEGHAEDEREHQGATGHRKAGSGSSADSYNYQDRGEEGGSSHPKPKEADR
jgi:hypothetical protein